MDINQELIDKYLSDNEKFWKSFHNSLKLPYSSFNQKFGNYSSEDWLKLIHSDKGFQNCLNLIFENSPVLIGEFPIAFVPSANTILTNFRLFILHEQILHIIPLSELSFYGWGEKRRLFKFSRFHVEYGKNEKTLIKLKKAMHQEYIDDVKDSKDYEQLNDIQNYLLKIRYDNAEIDKELSIPQINILSSIYDISKSLIIKYGYHESDVNNYPRFEGNYFVNEDYILIPTSDQIDQIISSFIAGNEGNEGFQLHHQSGDRLLECWAENDEGVEGFYLINYEFTISDGDSQCKTPLTKQEFTEAIHFFLSDLNDNVWEDLRELPDDCDLSKEIKKIWQEEEERAEAWEQEYQDKLERISQLKASIKKLLKEKAVKMPASDIDAHLKHQDVDEIKELCEEMYHNGEISRTGNYRYFILTEEKKKPKPKNASAAKPEKVDVKAELKKYKEMLDEGLITQEDYDAKKKELLGL